LNSNSKSYADGNCNSDRDPDGYDNCDANGHTRTNHAMASGYKVQRRHTMGGVIATTRNDGFYTDRIGGHGHGSFT